MTVFRQGRTLLDQNFDKNVFGASVEGQGRQEGQGKERRVGEREGSVVTGGSGERGKDHGKQSRGVRKKRGGQ